MTEIDEATVWTRKVLEVYGLVNEGDPYFQDARQVLSELIASKDGEIAKIVKRESETVDQLEVTLSELAALRAENERLKNDNAVLVQSQKPYQVTIGEMFCKAAERNPAEQKGDAECPTWVEVKAALADRVETSATEAMPGTNADALEVTPGDRVVTARALDTGSGSMTWGKLTASHRTPDQLWQAKRAAQAIAHHRTEAEARGYTEGRREALELFDSWVAHKMYVIEARNEVTSAYGAYTTCRTELKRMMMGGK